MKPPTDLVVSCAGWQTVHDGVPDDPSTAHFVKDVAESVADRVLRREVSRPGTAVVDLGPSLAPRQFRRLLLDLAAALDACARVRFGRQLRLLTLDRFDQQRTTAAHRDGAPDESLLILGYEPSEVPSRLFILDFTHAALDLGLTGQDFLSRFNPMIARGEDVLGPYAAEVTPFVASHYRIVVLNNSLSGANGARHGMLGVLHQALVPNPRPDKPRIVHSLVLEGVDLDAAPALSDTALQAFVEQAERAAG